MWFPNYNSQAIYWRELENGFEVLKCLDLKDALEITLDRVPKTMEI